MNVKELITELLDTNATFKEILIQLSEGSATVTYSIKRVSGAGRNVIIEIDNDE